MRKQKTYKQIEESRNRRLWVTEVIMPTLSVGSALYVGNPQFREWVNDKTFKLHEAITMKRVELRYRYNQWKAGRGA